jgi:hypothetical protein
MTKYQIEDGARHSLRVSGAVGSFRYRASLVLPPQRAEYLVRVQAVYRLRGLPGGGGAEIF